MLSKIDLSAVFTKFEDLFSHTQMALHCVKIRKISPSTNSFPMRYVDGESKMIECVNS